MTRPSPAGYSGKPLAAKMGLKPGMTCRPIDPPDQYADLMADADGVTFSSAADPADVVHLFCADRAALEAEIDAALAMVAAPKGMLWISWPKKSSKRFRDLTEDGLRAVVLPKGWVDVKVCAVDADWSGLKFLRRRG